MAKQVKIKDIALQAGVSAGTVDRILHNRGNVSSKSREAVEKVLAKVGYRYNIHASAISFRKEFNIAISIPTANEGEYWGSILEGLEHALEEYSDIKIKCTYRFYDQFDIVSCREAFDHIISTSPDAVILGPTFNKETELLCRKLDSCSIPYIFLDSTVKSTNPYETHTTDQFACGYLLGKLLDAITPENSRLAVFKMHRSGNQPANNSIEREAGFDSYMNEIGRSDKVTKAILPITDLEKSEKVLLELLKDNSDIKGIAVLNSRGYVLADILKKNGITDIKIISFDLTTRNREFLENGDIAALLCQKPKLQGFNAIKGIINKLLYNMPSEQVHHLMPIDVIFKENLPYYKEI